MFGLDSCAFRISILELVLASQISLLEMQRINSIAETFRHTGNLSTKFVTHGESSRAQTIPRSIVFFVAVVSLSVFKILPLSLGRVDPAPHAQHLLGPFEAIAQNSSLRSFSIVDSLANRQHSCRGSEELAIRKTARFQATPSYSELLRVGGAQELRATPSYFEPLRATPSCSEWGAPKNSELLPGLTV